MPDFAVKKEYNRLFLLMAALSGLLSVALGAFAAHGLKKLLTASQLETFHTGVEYQFMHTFALLFVALLPRINQWINLAGWSFIIGIILFSGSLYVLTLSGIRSLAFITPFGGMFFLIGWACLFIYAWKNNAEKNSNH